MFVKRIKILVLQCECSRCGHTWISESLKEPKVCPKCKNVYWNTPKRPTPKGKGAKSHENR